MKTQCVVLGTSIILASLLATAYASQDTIRPNGINSVGLTTFTGQPLNGAIAHDFRTAAGAG